MSAEIRLVSYKNIVTLQSSAYSVALFGCERVEIDWLRSYAMPPSEVRQRTPPLSIWLLDVYRAKIDRDFFTKASTSAFVRGQSSCGSPDDNNTPAFLWNRHVIFSYRLLRKPLNSDLKAIRGVSPLAS